MNSRATRLFSHRFVPSFTLTMALMSGFGFGVAPALAKSPEAARQVAEQSALGGDALTGLLGALADAPQGTIMGTELRDAFREAGLAETELSKFLEGVGSIRKQGDQVEIRSMEGASLNASGRGLHIEPLARMKIRKRDGQLEVAGVSGTKLSADPDSTRYPLNAAKLKQGSKFVNGTVNLGPKGRAKDLNLRFPLPKAAPKKRAPEEQPTKRQPNDLIGLVGALKGETGNPSETSPKAPTQPEAKSTEDAGAPAPEADMGPAEDRLTLTPGESVIALDGSKVEIPEGATHWSRGARFHVPEEGENPEGRGWLRLSPHANKVLGQDVPENATHYRPTVEFHGAEGPESNGGGTPELPSSPEEGAPEGSTSPTLPTAPSEPPSKPTAPKAPKSNKPPGMICEGGVCRPRTAADDLPKLPKLPTSPKKPSSSKPSLPTSPSKPANTQPSQPSQPTSPTSPSDMPRTAPPPAFTGPPKDLQSAIARAKSEGKLILVDFYADWCGPCVNMLQTSIPALERDPWVTQNVFIVKVNIDHNKALAQQFGVRGIPDLRVLGVTSQGQVKALRRATGYQSAGAVRSMLQNAR